MKAMILAAGLGTRLRPLTHTIPKPMVPVAGRPMIEYPLSLLKRHGIREVIINTHHLAGQIQDGLGDGSELGLSISYSHEPEILGTGGGIRNAMHLFGQGPILVINGDTLIDVDLTALINRHRQTRAAATMVLIELKGKHDFGPVEVDQNLRVRRIIGKPEQVAGAELRVMTFTGVHIIGPEILAELPEQGFSSIITEGYHKVLEQGQTVMGYRTRGYWKSLDTAQRVAEAESDILAQRFAL